MPTVVVMVARTIVWVMVPHLVSSGTTALLRPVVAVCRAPWWVVQQGRLGSLTLTRGANTKQEQATTTTKRRGTLVV